MEKVVILTGAGISAESGLGTFRGAGGLWEGYRVQDVASPEAFARDPALVHRFYNMRRAKAAEAAPNAAHRALARMQRELDGEVVIITQNVDSLHEAGGASDVLHMHGTLAGALCAACSHRWPAPAEMAVGDTCPACNAPAARADIVWFGEVPYHMDTIYDHLTSATLFAAIGTSGQVYPAAAFVHEAKASGAQTVELNLEPSQGASQFDEVILGPASETVPNWVDRLLDQR